MRKKLLFLSLILSTIFIIYFQANAASFPSTGMVDVYFSPGGGCTNAIINKLNSAKSEILIQAYSFTSVPIAKTLLEAKKRGVKIEVILDKSQCSEKYSSADFIAHAGISVHIDSRHKIAHNKIMIIDRNMLITGSFNFTKSAEESNAENLLILKGNKPLVDRYIQNFEIHKKHSEVYIKVK